MQLRFKGKPLALTAPQRQIEASPKRFIFVEAGRRLGKTIYGMQKLLKWSAKIKNEQYWYVAPQLKMAQEIIWDDMVEMVPPDVLERVDARTLTIYLTYGSKITLKGSDKADSMRGRRLGGVVMDEAAYQKSFVYFRQIRPMLADLKAPLLAISTPKVGWFTKICDNIVQNKAGYAEYGYHHFTIYDNPHISREEIAQIKAETPEHEWLQEYMAERVDFSGVMYPEFDAANHIFAAGNRFKDHRSWPGGIGIDWGSDDATGVIWASVTPEGHVVFTHEHVQNGWDPARHCDVINRINEEDGRDYGAKNVVLDQSAFAKEHKDKLSVAEEFRNYLGYMPSRSMKNLSAGINRFKRYLRGDEKGPWVFVSSNCKGLIQALQDHEWQDHEPDILASARYLLNHLIERRYTKLISAEWGLGKNQMKYPAASSIESCAPRLIRPGSVEKGKWRFGWDRDDGALRRRIIGQ
jgi:hypothetical protein